MRATSYAISAKHQMQSHKTYDCHPTASYTTVASLMELIEPHIHKNRSHQILGEVLGMRFLAAWQLRDVTSGHHQENMMAKMARTGL